MVLGDVGDSPLQLSERVPKVVERSAAVNAEQATDFFGPVVAVDYRATMGIEFTQTDTATPALGVEHLLEADLGDTVAMAPGREIVARFLSWSLF